MTARDSLDDCLACIEPDRDGLLILLSSRVDRDDWEALIDSGRWPKAPREKSPDFWSVEFSGRPISSFAISECLLGANGSEPDDCNPSPKTDPVALLALAAAVSLSGAHSQLTSQFLLLRLARLCGKLGPAESWACVRFIAWLRLNLGNADLSPFHLRLVGCFVLARMGMEGAVGQMKRVLGDKRSGASLEQRMEWYVNARARRECGSLQTELRKACGNCDQLTSVLLADCESEGEE